MFAYTDRPYLVIPVYIPCSRGPDKIKPVNGQFAVQRTSILRLSKQQENMSLCLKCTKTKNVQFSKIPCKMSLNLLETGGQRSPKQDKYENNE